MTLICIGVYLTIGLVFSMVNAVLDERHAPTSHEYDLINVFIWPLVGLYAISAPFGVVTAWISRKIARLIWRRYE